MFYGAKNKTVLVDGTPMHYVEFGQGQKPFVLLPGLSDGLQTVRGKARTFARYYREFAKRHRVYLFSRKENLQDGYTTKDMADDLKKALDALGIETINLMGVSQGGMIAQHFAIRYPGIAEKLVLTVSVSKTNDVVSGTIGHWVHLARTEGHRAMMIDMLEKTYSPDVFQKYKPLLPIITRLGKPNDWSRFFVQAEACLSHHTYDQLHQINCPTLIIGGSADRVVGAEASPQMAEQIRKSQLFIYEGLGHAVFEEAPDFQQRVLAFLK